MNTPIAWHSMFSLEDRRVLCLGTSELRAFATTVLGLGRKYGLLLFGLPDTHGHLVCTAERARTGRFVHDLETSLRRRLNIPVPFRRFHVVPVDGQQHLTNLVPYVLGNARKHGSENDPWCEGTNLPDLLGLRVNGLYTAANLKRACPRLKCSTLLGLLGCDELSPGTALDHLVTSAAAATGLPTIAGKCPAAVAARRAAAHVGADLGVRIASIAALLDISIRAAYRLLEEPPDEALHLAVRLQMGLRERVVSSCSAAQRAQNRHAW